MTAVATAPARRTAGWSAASGDTKWADQEVNARNSNDSAVAAASYGMSNADRFTGAPNTGWNAQDSGDGGYSRTLGGTGGISCTHFSSIAGSAAAAAGAESDASAAGLTRQSGEPT